MEGFRGEYLKQRLDTSGIFTFVDPNVENLTVELIDGCSNNDHFWAFYAATTDAEYTLTVTDTKMGQTKSYFNPLGQGATAITDTSAFATCP